MANSNEKIESYKKIDYRLRPAKSIERKMLAEAFRKLSVFGKITDYRYIGMGSLYFTDFILFHKQLGFKEMISMEPGGDTQKEKRFQFNCPFSCIKLKFGYSGSTLPKLDWHNKTITWLDYDGIVKADVLSDVAFISSKAISGNLLLVSANVMPDAYRVKNREGKRTKRLQGLKEHVGSGKVPSLLNENNTLHWGMSQICRELIHNEIEETLNNKNKLLAEPKRIRYKQLFNFQYQDGAKMLTVGGIFYEEKDKELLSKCDFESLEFYRTEAEAYQIITPHLTFKEIRAISGFLPKSIDSCDVPVSKDEIDIFSKLYRYFPHFIEAEI